MKTMSLQCGGGCDNRCGGIADGPHNLGASFVGSIFGTTRGGYNVMPPLESALF